MQNKTFDITSRVRGDGTGNLLYVVMMQDSDHNMEFSGNDIWRAKNEKHLKTMVARRVYNEDLDDKYGCLDEDLWSGRTQIMKIGKAHYHPSTPGIE